MMFCCICGAPHRGACPLKDLQAQQEKAAESAERKARGSLRFDLEQKARQESARPTLPVQMGRGR